MPLLSIDKLSVRFAAAAGDVFAVRELSLDVQRGECVGVVGESGSGKTQAFMAAMGLLGRNARTGGSVRFGSQEILGAPSAVLNRFRGSDLSMIFQDPMTSLTPHLKIGMQLAEVLVAHRGVSWAEAGVAALDMLRQVHVTEPERRLQQYPHELSGGMRQRVMIGMSLLCQPQLLIADEPTTALDVTVQAQILDTLRAMRESLKLAVVLISHDLAVVAGLADRVLILYAGRLVESAATAQLFKNPRHPYSEALLRCIPDLRAPRLARMPSLTGHPPSAVAAETGCAFAPRCPRAAARCHVERPLLEAHPPASQVACHYPLP